MKTKRAKRGKRQKTEANPSPQREPTEPVKVGDGVSVGGPVPPERLASSDTDAFIPDPERTHRRVPDDFAEFFGENFVQAVTTGNSVDSDEQDAVVPEEDGGPFLETDAETEFGDTLLQGSEFEDGPTLPEPFPTALRAGAEPGSGLVDEGEEVDLEDIGELLSDDDDDQAMLATAPPRPPAATAPRINPAFPSR